MSMTCSKMQPYFAMLCQALPGVRGRRRHQACATFEIKPIGDCANMTTEYRAIVGWCGIDEENKAYLPFQLNRFWDGCPVESC